MVLEKIRGPNPIEKRGTNNFLRFAAKKCPNSWTKIDAPKNKIAKKIDSQLKNIEELPIKSGAIYKKLAISCNHKLGNENENLLKNDSHNTRIIAVKCRKKCEILFFCKKLLQKVKKAVIMVPL
ncbi:MAG: hypothetical protein LBH08_00410 [Puniceicoccales bacterium]|jgi:hypothetical protein|nr:hypothetical protein [Puniceicoccales bacterium]